MFLGPLRSTRMQLIKVSARGRPLRTAAPTLFGLQNQTNRSWSFWTRKGTERTVQRDRLVIFLKAPRPGSVKTRLAAAIGAEAACDAYRCMVEVVLQSVRELQDVQLRFAPDDALQEITPWLRQTWSAAKQGLGDLGERLSRTITSEFENGADRLAIIGSDCPDVQESDIQNAWSALKENDVVLGPAEDGGYYLIGLRKPEIDLLKGIAWGSNTVLESTLARAKAWKLKVHLLRTLHDIDTVEDLRRWQARCSQP